MSYDLEVYGQNLVGPDALAALLSSAGLQVGQNGTTAGSTITVVRGARARHSFSLEPAMRLEPEDVPDEITAVVLEPEWLYTILVEGGAASEIPHAVHFARRLARAASGAVLDQQTGDVWSRGGRSRSVERIERGLVDVIELTWYTVGRHPGPVGQAWTEVAGSCLPEALPRRFGVVEPLQAKFDADDPGGFAEAVAAAQGEPVYFKADTPCISGHLTEGRDDDLVCSQGLTVHRAPMEDARWRGALRRLFVEFARSSGAFFASAEVQRNVSWSGGSIWFDGRAEATTHLAPRGRWAGLVPYPPWMAWFGADYAPLVADHLRPDQVEVVADGIVHVRSDGPADRDQLLAQLRQASRDRVSTWLPPELLATVRPSDGGVYRPPSSPARVIPARLRGH
jgi:hypothetical protein